MNETYVECLVKKKNNSFMVLLKIVTIMLAACFIFIGFTLWPALIIGALLALAAYFVYLQADIEYEYLYVDRELTVDKIMAKSKRKKIAKFDMERMEILAPIKSYHLDNYKNRTPKVIDYSSGAEQQPDIRYAMFYDGTQKIILEPSPELVKAIQMIAPRKVFKD